MYDVHLNSMVLHSAPIVIGYFLGGIPCGLLITKAFNLNDIRHIGSGNIGVTNVLRTGSKLAALLTLIGDLGKGFLAITMAIAITQNGYSIQLSGFAAVLGHCFSPYLKCKPTGKGVAVYFGCLLALDPLMCLFAAVVWICVLLRCKYASLACLVATSCSLFAIVLLQRYDVFVFALLSLALIFWRHRDNINRLKNKAEPKVY